LADRARWGTQGRPRTQRDRARAWSAIESDINGQISILENAVSGRPAAVVIAPTQFKALGQPIDEAAKNVKVIGIDSAADSKAFTSFLTTDNVQAGRVAADAFAVALEKKYGKPEGEVTLVTAIPGVGSLDQRAKSFKEQLPRRRRRDFPEGCRDVWLQQWRAARRPDQEPLRLCRKNGSAPDIKTRIDVLAITPPTAVGART
jgi:hypothetical protein